MGRTTGTSLFIGTLVLGSAVAAQSNRVPRIWDDATLADWATPVAGLNVRPAHYSAAEYYASPEDNYRTYPVYHPDQEPPGYWEWLQQQKPQPVVEAGSLRTRAAWIAAGERAFHEIDLPLMRTGDPAVIAQLRDPARPLDDRVLPDGRLAGPMRWVVTPAGVMATSLACSNCHRVGAAVVGPPQRAANGPLAGPAGTARRMRAFYRNDSLAVALWREFTVPWAPDPRVEEFETASLERLQQLQGPGRMGGSFSGGVFARANGSPFAVTKILDLQNLKDSRYMDVTGSHRLRGPEDVGRYAALVTGADRMDFGTHRILTDEQRGVRYHFADEVLYAIGAYLLSLDPPKNPNPLPADLVARGEQTFKRAECISCHAPPAYTTGQLTVASGFTVPPDHPNRADIARISVGTDADVALRTRKGTGFYKIPSLRGVWYRTRLLHDGSVASLEELFDPARLRPDYAPKGWNPPGVTRRAVPGHTFGLNLSDDDKRALLAFLRTL
jgi:cytochrome c551/c552